MRIRTAALITTLAAAVLTPLGGGAAIAQEAGTETDVTAGNASGYRTRLTELSADPSGPHTLTLTSNIFLAADIEPTYSGTQDLTIDGNGFTINGNDLNRIVDASTTEAAIHLVDLTVVDANASGGSGGAVNADGPVTVTDTTITSSESGLGDAVYAEDDITLTRAEITDNSGAVTLRAQGGDIEVVDSTITDNTGDNGGAIWAETFFTGGDVTVEGSLIARNSAATGRGGAVQGSVVTISDSSLIGNDADIGGAVEGRIVNLEDSTVAENTASERGGAIALNGAIDPSITVLESTLVQNSAPVGANLAEFPADPGVLGVHRSVVAQPLGGGADCSWTGTVSSSGSIESATSCGFDGATDLQNVADPRLGPPRDNGGGMLTMYPLWDSPAVDIVPPHNCDGPDDVDQRGLPRGFGDGCDAGAIEQVYPEHGFSDVAAWVEDAVRWLTSDVNDPPIMVGITPTTFEVADSITRAQVVRMLYREAGSPDVSALPPHGFNDVPAWVEDAVRWAKANEIMTGITPTTFVPNDPITRAQVVRAKYRLAGEQDVSALPPHGFNDVPPWVEDAVRWAPAHDIVTGITPTTFVPNDPITRGQVARMDYRLAINPDAWADPGSAPATLPFVAPGPF